MANNSWGLYGRKYKPYLFYCVSACVLITIGMVIGPKSGIWAFGDNWPGSIIQPMTELHGALSLWNYSATGAGSPSFNASALGWDVWGLFLSALRVGVDARVSITYTLLLVWEGLATIYFVEALYPGSYWGAIGAGLCLVLSLYGVTSLASLSMAFELGLLGLTGGWTLRRAREQVYPWWRIGTEGTILSLGLSLVGTPAAVVVLLLEVFWLVVAVYAYRPKWRRFSVGIAVAAVGCVVVNAWWIFAGWITVFGSQTTLTTTIQSPLQWAWVDRNAGIVSLLTMRGSWMWNNRAYYPWSTTLYGPWSLGQLSVYILIGVCVIGLLFLPRDWRMVGLLAIAVWLLIANQGLHSPFGVVNRILYLRIPGYWIFRDPQEEFGAALYLMLFSLAGVGGQEMVKFIVSRINRGWRNHIIAYAIGGLVALGVMVNAYAIVGVGLHPTKVLFGEADTVVRVPENWVRLGRYLNRYSSERVLVLPEDPTYQMLYDWGYYGTDQLASTFLSNPIWLLTTGVTDGGYYSSTRDFEKLQGQVISQLENGRMLMISRELRIMGVRYVLVRGDVSRVQPSGTIIAPSVLNQELSTDKAFRLAKQFGTLRLYEVKTLPTMIYALPHEIHEGSQKLLPLPYRQFSFSHYSIVLKEGITRVVLATSFSPEWNLVTDGGRVRVDPRNYKGLNEWIINVPFGGGVVDLVYGPDVVFMFLLRLAVGVSGLGMTMVILYWIRNNLKGDKS